MNNEYYYLVEENEVEMIPVAFAAAASSGIVPLTQSLI